MSSKTNAMRLLQQAKLPYIERFYPYDASDLSGLHAAQALGMPAEQVFKTLVARGERTGIQVYCIPVSCELDLRKAAKAAGDKHVELVPVKELLGLTGYLRGGCSPIGMKKKFPTYLDETCILWEEIGVSAGERGHQLLVSPVQLAAYLDATIVDLCV